jgi:2-polyprenyl-3-methyl-5-hydroxy-6-metoxy-1,4-benzoquinol methylase
MDTPPVRNPVQSRTAGFWRVADQFPALREVGTRVIDIGSGDGHLCAELKGAGWPEVVGVEASATRATRARALYPNITFYDRTLAKATLKEDSFDLVVMESVIEHLPEPLTQLREVRNFAGSGGRLVVTTPNMDSGHFRLLGRRWTGMLAPHAHIFLFTASSLRTALERAGFRVEAVGSFDLARYTMRQLISRLLSGDVKGALWRTHQELGTAYGRVVHQEPMLYAVGRAQ